MTWVAGLTQLPPTPYYDYKDLNFIVSISSLLIGGW